ncbi:hypothetical protein G6F66_015664 [Rhizopus arrhizus]|nr:hypothetical protein G6F66_015664 [Rhizopus arrhizus]
MGARLSAATSPSPHRPWPVAAPADARCRSGRSDHRSTPRPACRDHRKSDCRPSHGPWSSARGGHAWPRCR